MKASVSGKTVTLSGSLTTEEHRKLRGRISKFAPRLTVVDHIQVTQPGATQAADEEAKPHISPGRGEIEVLTGSVLGATANLVGPKGETQSARIPGRFEDLPPGRYQVEIIKAGYRTERRIVNLTAGHVQKVEVPLQAMMGGLIVNSTPSNAIIRINGQPHEERTPATIRLAPGNYCIDLEMEGYESASQSVQVQGEDLKQIDFVLRRMTTGSGSRSRATAPAPQQPAPQTAAPVPTKTPATASGPGFIDVKSVPPGADILIDGANTGRKTPAKVELRAGTYRITVFLRGFQAIQKTIQVAEGKTLTLNETLNRQ